MLIDLTWIWVNLRLLMRRGGPSFPVPILADLSHPHPIKHSKSLLCPGLAANKRYVLLHPFTASMIRSEVVQMLYFANSAPGARGCLLPLSDEGFVNLALLGVIKLKGIPPALVLFSAPGFGPSEASRIRPNGA